MRKKIPLLPAWGKIADKTFCLHFQALYVKPILSQSAFPAHFTPPIKRMVTFKTGTQKVSLLNKMAEGITVSIWGLRRFFNILNTSIEIFSQVRDKIRESWKMMKTRNRQTSAIVSQSQEFLGR